MNKDNDHDMNKTTDTTMHSADSKYMLQSVTCFTCHRGDPHPETQAPSHHEGFKPPASATENK